ncbi:MAG: hypothetical protein LBT59_10495 [Clostridiales bacterium]|jgi:hypothetical protein|nr:hypothetical protein [Clostridiales bacterium]
MLSYIISLLEIVSLFLVGLILTKNTKAIAVVILNILLLLLFPVILIYTSLSVSACAIGGASLLLGFALPVKSKKKAFATNKRKVKLPENYVHPESTNFTPSAHSPKQLENNVIANDASKKIDEFKETDKMNPFKPRPSKISGASPSKSPERELGGNEFFNAPLKPAVGKVVDSLVSQHVNSILDEFYDRKKQAPGNPSFAHPLGANAPPMGNAPTGYNSYNTGADPDFDILKNFTKPLVNYDPTASNYDKDETERYGQDNGTVNISDYQNALVPDNPVLASDSTHADPNSGQVQLPVSRPGAPNNGQIQPPDTRFAAPNSGQVQPLDPRQATHNSGQVQLPDSRPGARNNSQVQPPDSRTGAPNNGQIQPPDYRTPAPNSPAQPPDYRSAQSRVQSQLPERRTTMHGANPESADYRVPQSAQQYGQAELKGQGREDALCINALKKYGINLDMDLSMREFMTSNAAGSLAEIIGVVASSEIHSNDIDALLRKLCLTSDNPLISNKALYAVQSIRGLKRIGIDNQLIHDMLAKEEKYLELGRVSRKE